MNDQILTIPEVAHYTYGSLIFWPSSKNCPPLHVLVNELTTAISDRWIAKLAQNLHCGCRSELPGLPDMGLFWPMPPHACVNLGNCFQNERTVSNTVRLSKRMTCEA